MALRHLAQHADATGIEWIFAFLEDGPEVARFQSMGLETYVVKAGQLRDVTIWLRCVLGLAGIARRRKVDVVFGWMSKAHLYGGVAAALLGLPAVWFQHGSPSRKQMLDRMSAAVPARCVFACSSHIARMQQALLHPARRVRVVNPGVDIVRFDKSRGRNPEELREALGLPRDERIVGMVARLQRWKGVHTLIEAMPNVIAGFPDVRCVIVGGKHDLEPEYASFVESRISELGLTDRVLIAGFQENVPEWMQAMDVVVHASDNEPFGMVVIEAMALGKPVVSVNRGGPLEIITNGVDGLLVPHGDSGELAEAIVGLLADEPRRLEMGRRARTRASEFSTERFAARIAGAVEAAVEDSRGRTAPDRPIRAENDNGGI
jgi:glycosyltransferase involved in cell wall biosynthesis